MKLEPISFTSGQHSLLVYPEFYQEQTDLTIVKPYDFQVIKVTLPEDVTIEMIVAGWKAQGEQWFTLAEYDSTRFMATRAIFFEDGLCLMWHDIHIMGVSHDMCAIVPLKKEQWGNTVRLTEVHE